MSAAIAIFLIRTHNFYVPSFGTIREYGVNAYGGNITIQGEEKQIDWGTAIPGAHINRSFYVESECNVAATLEFEFTNWIFTNSEGEQADVSLAQYMVPEPDYDGTPVDPGESIYITITLPISDDSTFINYLIDEEVTEFSFDIHIYAK